ncbi:MAG TPA: hypothetical protein VII06_09580 [Chloroflexota bacterium]
MDAVDLAWLTLEPLLSDYQDSCLTAAGRYFQGYRSHSQVPSDGATAPPDVGSAHPADMPSWPPALLAGSWPAAVEVHCYEGTAGHGWVAILTVEIAGVPWVRVLNVGPEPAREQPWTARPVLVMP